MDKDIQKEILKEEELDLINKKIQKKEAISLPESLLAENVEELLMNPEIKKEKEIAPRKSKKKWAGFVALAASVAIVVTSVFVVKPWDEFKSANKFLPPEITVAEDYSQVEELFLAYAEKYEKMELYNDIFYGEVIADDAVAENGAASGTGAPTSPSVNGSVGLQSDNKNHGETNEQVAGVGEADIIKNDGQYIYVSQLTKYGKGMYLSDTTSPNTEDIQTENDAKSTPQYECFVDIVKPKKDGKLSKISTISVTTDLENVCNMSLVEMYVSGNRLIVFVNCSICDESNNNYYWYSYDTTTMAVCFDISDKSDAKELWRVYQDGSYISSRLIGEQLVILSEYYVKINGDEEQIISSCVPETAVNGSDFKRIPCDCICIMNEINDTSYLVASTMKVNDSTTFQTKAVLGGGSNVYCTTETLYVTSTKYENYDIAREVFGVADPKTNILKFNIKDNKIEYLGSCSVKGTTLNQFSMDEYNGNLRIATTTGSWGDDLKNQVYVIDSESLEVIGELTGLAPGESIRSVRFSGNTGYVVTFMQTDPLFVIDFSNPEKPVLKGELKITGFSSYLHTVGDNLLVGVGPDGTESGTNNGMKISLFDVSDPTNPKEVDKLVVDGLYSRDRFVYVSSPCYDTHKAFCWDSTENKMYIPYGKQDNDYVYGGYSATLGILGVKVDVSAKSLINECDYIKTVDEYKYSDMFTRVTYIDDVIIGYSYQGKTLVSFDKTTGTITDTLELK